ncbi:hypothetical protein RYX36_035669, partial [Vicia faba]
GSCRLSKDNPFGIKALRRTHATSTLNWTQKNCHEKQQYKIANEKFDLRRSKDSKDPKAQKVGKVTTDQLRTMLLRNCRT